ncbi:hypothetical protein DWB58_14395 [candidate division KSB1 bacterium]|nr:hypothetical protein [candidate division KSB1 bacterium]
MWGIVATANFMASTAAHKGRGLQTLFIQMKNAVFNTKAFIRIQCCKVRLRSLSVIPHARRRASRL